MDKMKPLLLYTPTIEHYTVKLIINFRDHGACLYVIAQLNWTQKKEHNRLTREKQQIRLKN